MFARQRSIQPLLFTLLLLAFTLRLFHLTTQSFWYDEGFTFYFARLPLAEQLPALLEINPIPTHYLLTSGWMKLAGTSPYALRYLSVLGSLLAVALCYRLGRAMAGPAAGLLAALGLALSPMHIYYAQEARAYAWLTALALASAYLLYRALHGLRSHEVPALAIIQALTLFTQVYALFTIAALNLVVMVSLLARRPSRRQARAWAIANILTLTIVIPWYWAARGTELRNVIYYRGSARWQDILWNAAQSFSVGEASPSLHEGILLFWLLVIGALLLALLNRLSSRWSFLLAGCLAPIVGILIASIDRSRYNARYIIAGLPFFYLLFALSWSWLQQRARPAGLLYGGGLAALLLLMGIGTFNQYTDPRYYRPDFRAVSEYIQQHGDPAQDGIVMVGGHFHPILRYFLGERFAMYPIPPDVIHNVDRPISYSDLDLLNEAARKHRRLWLILWQRELADPGGIVLDQMISHTIRHEVFARFGEIDMLLFELPPGLHFDTSPTPRVLVEQRWGEGVELWGYDLEPGTAISREQSMELTLYWRPLATIEEDFFVSAQLIGPDGRLYAQADHIAYTDFYPPSQWKPGELLLDRYRIDIPADMPPEGYQLILVLYDREGQRRLTLEGQEFVELEPRIELHEATSTTSVN